MTLHLPQIVNPLVLAVAIGFFGVGCSGPEALMQRGNMAYRDGNPTAAAEFYAQALNSPETKSAAGFNLGRIALEQGQADKAREYFEQAMELEVEYPLVRVYHARALIALGRLEEAQRDLERVLKGPTRLPDASLELAKLLAHKQQFREAIEVVQPALAVATFKEESTLLEASWRHQIGDLNGAIARLEELLKSHGYRVPTHFTLADYLMEAGDYREAERKLRSGLEMQPQNTEAILKLAMCLEKTGKRDEARQLYSMLAQSGDANHPMVKRAIESLERLGPQGE